MLPAASNAARRKGPSRQVESFKVVIEGTNTGRRHFSELGQTGLCEIHVAADFTDKTSFARGRGVTIQLERVRRGAVWQYTIKRIGFGKAEFTVVATVDREASGVAQKAPIKNASFAGLCPATEENVATAACGKPVVTRSDLGFKLRGTEFTLRPASALVSAPALKALEACGKIQLTEGVTTPEFAWPNLHELDYVPFPEEKLFSTAHAVVAILKGEQFDESKSGTPPLLGTITDGGNAQVTVRFIRCGKRPFPACP
jgi:hypothetical protein